VTEAKPSLHETHNLAAPCPLCGCYAGSTLAVASPLLAVADVLVLRCLEQVGKRLARKPRGRYQQLGSKPFHLAHTIGGWRPSEEDARKTTHNPVTWAVVPPLFYSYGIPGVNANDLVKVLADYSCDLLITATPHHHRLLQERLKVRLGLDLTHPDDLRTSTKQIKETS